MYKRQAIAFRQGLKEAGFVEGQNVTVEYRYADNQRERLQALAAGLISLPVAVIVANGVAAFAAISATRMVPVIFATGSDPVRDGLVSSLHRPGGNVTGVVFFGSLLGAKRLEMLRQFVPGTKTIAVLANPGLPNTDAELRDLQAAALAIGQPLVTVNASSERDIEAAFPAFVQSGAGALLVGSGPLINAQRNQIVALAARHRLPASYPLREFAVAGGLMSYGSSQADSYRQAGIYAGRILKGDKPGDLPVVQSTQFEFVINLKTAKALGLEFHPQLLATVDEVIE